MASSQSDRVRTLRAVRDRVTAEIVGVENGVLPLIEEAQRPVKAREVAARLGMSIPGANNALKALWLAGLIERERVVVPGGGRAFTYRLGGYGNGRVDTLALAENAAALESSWRSSSITFGPGQIGDLADA